ncbi:MAG: carboxypeptidase regulatory-like domain-containing protein [Bacteroidales bacterium]|nr:carboxypeptidase regulatory-like domain-containing protein [Bacteroidales bacterium]
MFKNFLALITLLVFVNFNSFAQKETEGFALKYSQAWLMFNNENFKGALRLLKEIYPGNENHAMLNYRIGFCYVELKTPDSALQYLQRAIELDTSIRKDAYLLLGQAYHYNGDIDKALEYYYKYKSKLSPKQGERDYVNVLIEQAITAKELMKKPVEVKIENAGNIINSKFVDANPSITADGKTLIFTTRRPDNTGGKYDYEADCYYDDIYIAKWDEKNKQWSEIKNIGAPINTDYHDANTSISPDGNVIFIYKNIPGVTGSGDIYYSEKGPTGEWSNPKPLPKQINSTYFESSACVTSDGSTMFFVSERKEGLGHGDIYMVKKVGETWGIPENLGPVVNTPYDEIGVYIHPDGKTLFFSSKGHNTMGGYDIFMTYFENGQWSKPINLGYPINTTRDEIHFVLTSDRRNAYISSNREGGYGEFDIYKVDMSKYFNTYKEIPRNIAQSIIGNTIVIMKGKVSDADNGNPLSATLIFKDLTDEQNYQTETNSDGEYFITLTSDRRYEVLVKADGYKPYTLKFKTQKVEGFETPTTLRHFLLNKE